MKIFLVGGAVRDKKLNLPVYDRDWVIEGATPEEMIAKGFQQVGKDFPVFLHAKSHEEYALARTERKSGIGYTGFTTYFAPHVTLEEDLRRRDLTINAMAESIDGKLIDPYGGLNDINNKVLRHVSEAFHEDPLRVLRVARFAARFAHLGFNVAPETMELMRQMTVYKELQNITPERVWSETQKALTTKSPQVYFQLLRDCGALAILFTEIDNLFETPAPEKSKIEMNTGVHTLTSLSIAAKITKDVEVRFAILTHDLGKGLAYKSYNPYHYKHQTVAIELIDALCRRICIPKYIREFAKIAAEYHLCVHNIKNMKPIALLKLFDAIDAWRKPHRLDQIIIVGEADARGNTGFENHPYPQGDYLRSAYKVAINVSVREIVEAGFKGSKISEELRVRHLHVLKKWKNDFFKKNKMT
ncbi:multifunctional CCA addition/repair protein [Candidatus Profftia tarda]|uniref:multifunctional CCA addition/repair protein n=1 Tax=Candidatus Profftia tarda TaxID=1177216 RepID=UPI001C1FEC8B|nr:multifunctional CCA addition/repair protein [Candidatus Profftia tarda]